MRIEQPANHMTEEARWDYRVTIRFKNSTLATTANPDEERLIRQLWTDQETYKREEQRLCPTASLFKTNRSPKGLSYRQIARRLGIGEGTVRRVLNSA